MNNKEAELKTTFGHSCRGTSVDIKDSPITVTLHTHIHIHTESATLAEKIGRAIHGIFGERHQTIENAAQLSKPELQRVINRQLEN